MAFGWDEMGYCPRQIDEPLFTFREIFVTPPATKKPPRLHTRRGCAYKLRDGRCGYMKIGLDACHFDATPIYRGFGDEWDNHRKLPEQEQPRGIVRASIADSTRNTYGDHRPKPSAERATRPRKPPKPKPTLRVMGTRCPKESMEFYWTWVDEKLKLGFPPCPYDKFVICDVEKKCVLCDSVIFDMRSRPAEKIPQRKRHELRCSYFSDMICKERVPCESCERRKYAAVQRAARANYTALHS